MSKVINMEGVRSGTAHLKRAKELGKARGARSPRPVPVAEIVNGVGNVFTVEELSQLVRLAPITIRRAIRSGALRAANGGGKSGYRITRGDIEAWWRSRGGGDLFGATGETRDFLAILEESAPRIAAGTARPITSDNISDAIAESRP